MVDERDRTIQRHSILKKSIVDELFILCWVTTFQKFGLKVAIAHRLNYELNKSTQTLLKK